MHMVTFTTCLSFFQNTVLILDQPRLRSSCDSEDESLCVPPAAINNGHYFNYQQPSPERQDDDSFIIMSLQCGPGFTAFLPAASVQAAFFIMEVDGLETLT